MINVSIPILNMHNVSNRDNIFLMKSNNKMELTQLITSCNN